MTNNGQNTPEYYQRREQQERALAGAAMMDAIRAIHLDLAERYAMLANGGDASLLRGYLR